MKRRWWKRRPLPTINARDLEIPVSELARAHMELLNRSKAGEPVPPWNETPWTTVVQMLHCADVAAYELRLSDGGRALLPYALQFRVRYEDERPRHRLLARWLGWLMR
jgi:hypothetical protein